MRIVPASLAHVGPIALNMRAEDRIECEALGRTPKEALRLGLRMSLHCLSAIEDDGTPVCMLGLFAFNALTGVANPWFLGTPRVFMHPRALLCIGRQVLDWWKAEFPILENEVWAGNEKAIRLLKRWGFEIGNDATLRSGVPFVRFAYPAIQAERIAA